MLFRSQTHLPYLLPRVLHPHHSVRTLSRVPSKPIKSRPSPLPRLCSMHPCRQFQGIPYHVHFYYHLLMPHSLPNWVPNWTPTHIHYHRRRPKTLIVAPILGAPCSGGMTYQHPHGLILLKCFHGLPMSSPLCSLFSDSRCVSTCPPCGSAIAVQGGVIL